MVIYCVKSHQIMYFQRADKRQIAFHNVSISLEKIQWSCFYEISRAAHFLHFLHDAKNAKAKNLSQKMDAKKPQ